MYPARQEMDHVSTKKLFSKKTKLRLHSNRTTAKDLTFCFVQAKLRLEMAAEHDKHMVHKDLEAKEEEMEQLRFNMQKKVILQFFQLFCIFLFFSS